MDLKRFHWISGCSHWVWNASIRSRDAPIGFGVLPFSVKMYIYTNFRQKRPHFRVFLNVSRMFHALFSCRVNFTFFWRLKFQRFHVLGFNYISCWKAQIPLYGIFYAPTALKFTIFRVNIHFAILLPFDREFCANCCQFVDK